MAKTHTEHVEHPRSLKARAFPFAWHWIMALGILPGAATLLWHLGRLDPMLRALLAAGAVAATWVLSATIEALAEHAGRRPFIVKHAVRTVLAIGTAWTVTILWGWPPAWAVVYFFGALVGAASWNAHRVDALRSRPDDKGEDKGLAEVLGMPHIRFGKPKVVQAGVVASVTAEPGGTVKDVQDALPKLEAAAHGAIPGRSRVVQDPANAARGELTLAYEDVLRTWQPWPGPSALGGSIAQPIVTGFYEDGAPERYWFCAGRTDEGEPRIGTHIGRMGMTGSGKSGSAKIELAELLTRRDVVLLYADLTKGAQTSGALMDGITLYADTKPKVRVLFAGVRQLVRDRADRLGRAGFGDWSPKCATDAKLRMPAVVLFCDEADEYITDPKFVWLCTKARSAGVFLSVTLPRADHVSMPPTARFSIGGWMCFGVGDDYSAEFALTDAVVKAGAHPENWRNTRPGYHFLATAPGVDATRWPVPVRTFLTDEEDAQIRAAVAAGRPYRMALPPEDVASLGDAWRYCQPGDARRTDDQAARMQAVADDPELASYAEGLARKLAEQDDGEDEDMDDFDEQDDGGAVATMHQPPAPGDEEEVEVDDLDPSQPLGPYTGPDLEFDTGGKPDAVSKEQAVAAFDALLVRYAGEGRTEVELADATEDFPFRSYSWLAQRLSDVAEGAVVSPPGLTLERTSAPGRYGLVRLNGGYGQS